MNAFIKLIAVAVCATLLMACSGLKSRADIGLSPEKHKIQTVDVRQFTDAPLKAEVKVFLPLSKEKAMSIVADFDDYPSWVEPAPDKVSVDNSKREDNTFGAGSIISYQEGQSDVIEFFDAKTAMIAKPQWGLDNFDYHRGVVLVTDYKDGSIIHMRRYFESKGVMGWFMSIMMPSFMKDSAENLAEKYNGEVL